MAHHATHRQPDDESRSLEGDEKTCDSNNNSGAQQARGNAESRASTGCLVERNRSSLARTFAAIINNSEENTEKGSISSLGDAQRQQRERQFNSRVSRKSESNASESDDWHLLDADGQSDGQSSPSASSVSSNREFTPSRTSGAEPGRRQSNRREKRVMAQKMSASTRAEELRSSSNNNNNEYEHNYEESSGYIDVEPVERDNLSPKLIHICTALYALLPLASLLAFVTLFILIFTRFWPVTVVYYSYLVFDAKTCNRGGRRWPSVYKAKFWSYLAAYFPVKLRYSDRFKLDPNENYILNYHPHGISAFGCVASFATDGLQFSRLFPGVRPRFMVHETSFLVPIMRETFMTRGDCSVNSKSFDYILEKRWRTADGVSPKEASGNLLALCGGGLAEADLSDMETLKIVCASRKGFVKKSLIHGAHLIPCIAFGENSVFRKVNFKPGSFLYRLEKRWYELFKFKHPIYYGRSILFGDLFNGSMPYKRPITVVMGDPIHVERVADPSQKEIDDLHSLYIQRLKSMYKDNKESLCQNYDIKLKLV